jgi:hypothetical protein
MNADTKPPLHVVLIQDVREVREGLAALISGTTGYECVAAYGMMELPWRASNAIGLTSFSPIWDCRECRALRN